jgi:hypothetical protein
MIGVAGDNDLSALVVKHISKVNPSNIFTFSLKLTYLITYSQ